jgi:hypothetical protein
MKEKKKKESREHSEQKSFSELLLKRDKIGKIILNKKLFDETLPKLKPLLPFMMSPELGSFFTPCRSNWKIRDLLEVIDKFGVSKEDFSSYIEQDLMSNQEEKGDSPVTLYTLLFRFTLVSHLHKSLGYSIARLKEIIEIENFAIESLKWPIGEVDGRLIYLYPDLSGLPHEFLGNYCGWLFDYAELMKQKHGSLGLPQSLLVRISKEMGEDDIDLVEYLSNFNLESAGKREASFVALVGLMLWYYWEQWKIQRISLLHMLLRKGYSPQFLVPALDQGSLDMQEAIRSLDSFPWVNFFRTPDFEIFVEKSRVTMTIFDARRITTTDFKGILSIYAQIRKRLKAKRRAWGETGGKRKFYDTMQAFIREEYKKLKDQSPEIRFDDALDLISEQTKEKFGVVYSYETLRRKIYSKGVSKIDLRGFDMSKTDP